MFFGRRIFGMAAMSASFSNSFMPNGWLRRRSTRSSSAPSFGRSSSSVLAGDAVVVVIDGTPVGWHAPGARRFEGQDDGRPLAGGGPWRTFRFAAGRAPELADTCVLGTLRARFHEAEGDMRELMVALITSPELRARPIVTPIATEAP